MKFLSIEFLGLAAAACVLLPLTKGALRWTVFFALNAVFAASHLAPDLTRALFAGSAGDAPLPESQAIALASTTAFLLLGYVVAQWVRRGPGRTAWAVVVLTAAFAWLRGYGIVRDVLPAGWVHDALATVGLSFLFFKMLHVAIDAAAGTAGDLDLGTYVNYCLNFTTFLMGPIQRYQDFRAQWSGADASIAPGFEAHLDAVARIARGLVKKYVLAEILIHEVIHPDLAFETVSAGELALRTILFYPYLYCDFSGYCDVAIGVGSLMGVRPPENFRFPFLSRNVSEYWLRVHRSLTTWLTDYVFQPAFAALLRSRAFAGRTFPALALALLATMLVSGLWHGTTLAWVAFGLVHGVFLVVHRGYETWMKRTLGAAKFRAWTAHGAVHAAAVLLTWTVTTAAYTIFALDFEALGRLARRLLPA